MTRHRQCAAGLTALLLGLFAAPAAAQGITITEIIDATGDGMGNIVFFPTGIAVDGVGNVYVSGVQSDNVFRIKPGGEIEEIIDVTGDGMGNGLDAPTGLAVDAAGNVYVAASGGGDRVFEITPHNVVTELIDSSGDGLGNVLTGPRRVAVDVAGNVYVTGLTSDNAFKITPQGAISEIIDSTGTGEPGEGLDDPFGIAVDASGNVYVCGNGSHNVFKITAAGVISLVMDTTGDGTNALLEPSDVAVDAAGNLYVAGQTSDNAFKVTPGGTITEIVDSTGTGGPGGALNGSTGICTDADGNVFVAGLSSGNVIRISPSGEILEVVDNGDAGQQLTGLAVSTDGDVYVVAAASDNAFLVDMPSFVLPVEEILRKSGDGGSHPLDGPSDVAVDAAGNTYVASQSNDRVFKLTPGGALSVILDATGDGQGNTLSGPNAIAVDATGNVWVTGETSNNLFRITPAGAVSEWYDDDLVLDTPSDVAVDGSWVYVCGRLSNNVVRITGQGSGSEIIDASGDGLGNVLTEPRALVVDAAGKVYVAASGSENVLCKPLLTPVIEIIDASGGDGDTLGDPFDLALDGLGNVYVAGARSDNVFRITPQGAITRILDDGGDDLGHSLEQPEAVAADAAGNVYVAGSGSDNAFWISPGGTVTQVIGPGGDGFHVLDNPGALALDGEGGLLVTGFESDNVFRVQVTAPPAPQQPLPSPTAALDGRSGRATVGLPPPPPGGGDEFIPKPYVVLPDTVGDKVAVEVAEVQQGDISFGSPAETFGGEFATGGAPVMARRADFDLDGGDDIITANSTAASVSFLESDEDFGDLAFEPQVELALPSDGGTVAVAAADLDGDAELDIVAAGDDGVTVFLATAPGTFGAGTFTDVNGASPSFHTDLATGDFDGDTSPDPDVVTTSGTLAPADGFITVLQNTAGALSVVNTIAVGQPVASVLMGEFDDTDGPDRDDLLVVIHEEDVDPGAGVLPQATIALYVSTGGGSFALSGTAFTGGANEIADADGIVPTYGAAGDIDNDGDLDAVFTSSETLAHAPGTFGDEYPPVVLTVLLNDGAGAFTVSHVATAYAGKGISPMLQDLAPTPPEPGGPFLDAILVWYDDANAGLGEGEALHSYVTALLWDDELGTFVDASPNQFLAGSEPGNGAIGELGTAASSAVSAPELVVPNALPDDPSGAITVFLNDGAGALTAQASIEGISDLDPEVVQPLGTWEGGPRDVVLADVDGDGHLDAIVYSEFEDVSGLLLSVPASLAVLLGDGLGDFTSRSAYLEPARGGSVAAGELDDDAFADVVLSQDLGSGGGEQVLVYGGSRTGALSLLQTVAMPGSAALSGGLVLADLDGDGDLDAATTAIAGGTRMLVTIVDPATAPVVHLHPLAASWTRVRSLDAADVTGDGRLDVVIGGRGGQLVVAAGNGTGGFSGAVLGAQAAAVGGGAVTVADVTGDGRADVLASHGGQSGALDQSFVRMLRGLGGAAFEVSVLGGVSSVGRSGPLRPLLADMDDDGTTDTVLVHGGTAGSVSVLLNQLGAFEVVGTGAPGPGGIAPTLRGRGYSTPAGQVELRIADAVGGGAALLLASGPEADAFADAWSTPIGPGVVVPLDGAPGAPGAGGATLTGTIPLDPTLVGEAVVFRAYVGPAAGAAPHPAVVSGGGSQAGARSSIGALGGASQQPTGLLPAGAPKAALTPTNKLVMTIVDGS